MEKKIFIFFIVLIAGFHHVSAQSIEDKDVYFSQLYNQINILSEGNNWEERSKASSRFSDEFKAFITEHKETMEDDFKNLSKYIHIVTSKDKNLKIYSWDTQEGGTMKFFDRLIQYKTGDKVHTYSVSPEEGDSGAFTIAIHSIEIQNRKYYLVVDYSIGSTKDHAQSVQAYTIDKGKLDDKVKIFKTSKELLNTIHFYFDFFSVVDRKERPIQLIQYNNKKKSLYIPVVNEAGIVSNSFLVYTLKGNYLKYTGIQKNIK